MPILHNRSSLRLELRTGHVVEPYGDVDVTADEAKVLDGHVCLEEIKKPAKKEID